MEALTDELSAFHKLADKWTLWYLSPLNDDVKSLVLRASRPALWEDGSKNRFSKYKEIMSFNYIEDFWRMFNNIKSPTEINNESGYYIFKYGIEPLTTHSKHIMGGFWSVQIDKNDLDFFWLCIVLACVGGDFESKEYYSITGFSLTIGKKESKISIWCETTNEKRIMNIKNRFMEILGKTNDNDLIFTTCTSIPNIH